MLYIKKTNQYIQEGQPFNIDGMQYPSNWLEDASQYEVLGIEEVTTEGSPKDPRYYFVSEELIGAKRVITSIPRDLDMLKSHSKTLVNQQAATILSKSDWKVTRALEAGEPVPEELKLYRINIRTQSNDMHTAIDLANSVDELAALNKKIKE